MKFFRVKKLDIFITKQFGLLFVGTFFICQFVLMMQFLWRYVDELIGKGLSMEVMAQFFWYMGLMLMPQAFPLAILLSSLITFGNLGESSELTAIKAAGVPLFRAFHSLVVITILITIGSFYFQNNIGPRANVKLSQLLISMKQKSPELEIPEGIFYDGIPGSNIFVSRKDMTTGKLYGVTIYRMTGSYEDQAIILADSGMLQATADKKHLLMTLWNGEWFENMQSSDLGNNATIPYRRESFFHKTILIDFNTDFNITDASILSNDARGKGLKQILHDIDSLNHQYDSIGHRLYADMSGQFYRIGAYNTTSLPITFNEGSSVSIGVPTAQTSGGTTSTAKQTSGKKKNKAEQTPVKENLDSIYARLTDNQRRSAVSTAIMQINSGRTEMEFRGAMASGGEQLIREHKIQAIAKFTLAFSCIIFFFIGAPLGAIIRKGGLGMPVIISVLVFIVFYIFDNTGTRMAKLGAWNMWFGCLLATGALTPLAAWVTYKANNDSMVFNLDTYKAWAMRLLGLRMQRHIAGKEVIINNPDYTADAETLKDISSRIDLYTLKHKLLTLPNPVNVFFKYEPDHDIEHISDMLEQTIDDLSNTRDKLILTEINHYPILATKAHTRPFNTRWKNVVAAILLPLGILLYCRMVRYRIRLHGDLTTIKDTNRKIADHIASSDIRM